MVRRCSRLRATWSRQTREFLENSSLHGVRYLTSEHQRHDCERVMWVIFLSLGTAATGFIIASLWDKFQTSPTITGLDADFHEWDVPFPAVTFCPDNSVDMDRMDEFLGQNLPNSNESEISTTEIKNSLLALANLSYQKIGMLDNLSDLPFAYDSLQEIMVKISLRCEQIFEECSWKEEPISCCHYFHPIFTENGFCFSFNSGHATNMRLSSQDEGSNTSSYKPEYIFESDAAWKVMFKSQMVQTNPMQVFIHPWDEVVTRESRAQHLWRGIIAKIAFSVKHTYTTEDARQLSVRQRKCVFADEIELVTARQYSYSACMVECRMWMALKLCGCVPFFNIETEEFRHCRIEDLMCLSKHSEMLNDIRPCSCELGCDHMVYEVEKLSDSPLSPVGTLEVGFVSWPMVRYKREVLFGWVDLLVSFGGIAGLFLGFSLLSGVEIFYYFTVRAAFASRGENKNHEDTQQVKTRSSVCCLRKRKVTKKARVHVLKRLDDTKWAEKVLRGPAKDRGDLPFHIPYMN